MPYESHLSSNSSLCWTTSCCDKSELKDRFGGESLVLSFCFVASEAPVIVEAGDIKSMEENTASIIREQEQR